MRALSLLLLLALAFPASGQTRYEWVGGASGDWTEATNWSPNGVPAASDTAVVGEVSQNQRVAILTETTTVAGLHLLGQGAVAGDFDLTVTADFLWSAGGPGIETIRGSGTLTNASTSTLHLAEGTTRFTMADGRTLVNDGSILWDGSGSWGGAGRLVNNGEILLAMSGSEIFVFSSLPDAFTNTASGVIRRAGTGSPQFSSGMVNEGLIRVESGALNLRGFNGNGVRGAGAVEILDGARLDVGGGVNEVASVTGDALDLGLGNNSTLRVSGAYDVTTTRITSNGVLRLNGASTTETLEMAAGRIEGEGALTVTGSMDWTGGTMDGDGATVLGPAVPLAIAGDATLRLGGTRTLRTEGPVTWTGDADLSAGTSDTVFENAGTLTSSGDGERGTNFITFRNTGTVVHDGGALRFNSPMENAGVIRIEDGTLGLQFSASGTDTGRYEIGATGRLEVATPRRTFAEGAEVVGTGTFKFTSGFVNQATWRPGTSPGTLTIDSIWPAPAPEAVLEIEIGGPEAGTDFDQVVVNGEAALGGTLRVTLLDGYTPVDGDRFPIITATDGASGTFDALDLPDGLEAFVDATEAGADLVIGRPVSNEGGPEAVPDALALAPPAPNPAAASVTLSVALPEAGPVRLAVYDALGREVAVLVDRVMPAGTHAVRLDAGPLAPGVYVVRLGAGTEAVTQRLTVVR